MIFLEHFLPFRRGDVQSQGSTQQFRKYRLSIGEMHSMNSIRYSFHEITGSNSSMGAVLTRVLLLIRFIECVETNGLLKLELLPQQ